MSMTPLPQLLLVQPAMSKSLQSLAQPSVPPEKPCDRSLIATSA
jgi:hypothetical protein